MHYVELEDDGTLSGIFPLQEEIANTAFYNGIVAVLPGDNVPGLYTVLSQWKSLTGNVKPGDAVAVCHLNGVSISAAELGAGDGGSNGYVERL